MKKQNIILIVGAVIGLVIIAALFIMMQDDKKSLSATAADDDGMQALIADYDNILDYNTQVAVWMYIFQKCPYWAAHVREMYRRHGSSQDTLQTRMAIEADYAISKGRKPLDYMKKCNDKFSSGSEAYDECIKKQKSRNALGWIWTLGIHRLTGSKFYNVDC